MGNTSKLYSPLCPVASIEVPVPYGFGDVLTLNLLAAFKVGDGAGDLQDAAVGAGRELQPFHCHAEHVEAGGIWFCKLMQHLLRHLRIAMYARVGLEALLLYFPCLNDPLPDDRARFAWLHLRKLGKRHGLYLAMDVDTVEDYVGSVI